MPATILLIGEAPGVSEDDLGSPFKGPAGKVLDKILGNVLEDLPYCITNLVGCIPLDNAGSKAGEPSVDCIKACEPRLKEITEIVQPLLIVGVGKLASKWARKILDPSEELYQWCDIIHPAAILRMEEPVKSLSAHRATIVLDGAVDALRATARL